MCKGDGSKFPGLGSFLLLVSEQERFSALQQTTFRIRPPLHSSIECDTNMALDDSFHDLFAHCENRLRILYKELRDRRSREGAHEAEDAINNLRKLEKLHNDTVRQYDYQVKFLQQRVRAEEASAKDYRDIAGELNAVIDESDDVIRRLKVELRDANRDNGEGCVEGRQAAERSRSPPPPYQYEDWYSPESVESVEQPTFEQQEEEEDLDSDVRSTIEVRILKSGRPSPCFRQSR